MSVENKKLNAYLLGLLSESETEEFDEMSIADDDFAVALQSAENDLIDAYLNDELSESDAERFQAYFLASPLRREKLKFAESLKIVANKQFKSNNQPTEKGNWTDIFASFRMFWQFGLASLALVAIGFIGWNFWKTETEVVKIEPTPTPTQQTISPTPTLTPTVSPMPTITPTVSPTNSPTPKLSVSPTPKIEPTVTPTPKVEPTKEVTPKVPTLATFVLPLPTRNSTNLTTLNISPKTTDVIFTLPLESDDFKTYQITLKTQSGKILRQSGKIKSLKNALNIKIPARLLQSDIYNFTVSGISDTGEAENIGNYSFKTEPK
jgi:hypothetical protein